MTSDTYKFTHTDITFDNRPFPHLIVRSGSISLRLSCSVTRVMECFADKTEYSGKGLMI
jgi:hypothetical protein